MCVCMDRMVTLSVDRLIFRVFFRFSGSYSIKKSVEPIMCAGASTAAAAATFLSPFPVCYFIRSFCIVPVSLLSSFLTVDYIFIYTQYLQFLWLIFFFRCVPVNMFTLVSVYMVCVALVVSILIRSDRMVPCLLE